MHLCLTSFDGLVLINVWFHLMCVCVCRVEIMEQLIQSSDLFVMQVEMDVYTALKKVGDGIFPKKHFVYDQHVFCPLVV